jgi:hypothetical protein
MKLRQHIHQNKLKQVAILYPYLLLIFITPIGLSQFDLFTLQEIIQITFASLIVLALLILFIHKKAICPKCSFNFYRLSVRIKKVNHANYCPGCGINLESELE